MLYRLSALLFCLLLLLPLHALGAEGDPLLSIDDLLTLSSGYEAFLNDLEELAVSRGLLSENERQAWHDAQMGDFFQNGGYGSILINYMPGVLNLARAEETLLTLQTSLPCGTLEVLTVHRYTPQDSSLSGLSLTPSLTDSSGVPANASFSFSASSGVFLKWDALTGAYVSVGVIARSDGETVCWSDQTPSVDARDPRLFIDVLNPETGETLGSAVLALTVDKTGYLLSSDSLSAAEAVRPDSAAPAP